MIRRIALMSALTAVVASSTGCANLLSALPIPIPGLGGERPPPPARRSSSSTPRACAR
jgi:hypothetical protein